MKLVLIGLAILAFPVITGIAEWWVSDHHQQRLDILWMADHDRQTQAMKPTNRRMGYATIGKKKSPGKRWHAAQGQINKINNRITRKAVIIK